MEKNDNIVEIKVPDKIPVIPIDRDIKIIFVNKKEIDVRENVLTGKQILELAQFDPQQYDLFLVTGQLSEKIKLDQEVPIKNKLQFNAIIKSAPYG